MAGRELEGLDTSRERWQLLVAITGTVSGQKALERAIDLAERTDAHLVGLVIQGRLPRYAATIGEIESERKRRGPFYDTVARLAADQAAEKGVELDIRRRNGPFARTVLREAVGGRFDLVVVGLPTGRSKWHTALRVARLSRELQCSLLIAH